MGGEGNVTGNKVPPLLWCYVDNTHKRKLGQDGVLYNINKP